MCVVELFMHMAYGAADVVLSEFFGVCVCVCFGVRRITYF